MPDRIDRSAVISDCASYRYRLNRVWRADKAQMLFVMLNPSTADALRDDPTIRRCMGFARWHGYGGIRVGNLYAFRATNPTLLRRAKDPVGPENAAYLDRLFSECTAVIAAWGSSGARWAPKDSYAAQIAAN